MRSKSGPDKNRRQSKEGQGAKPIAASKPIKAKDRSDAERRRPRLCAVGVPRGTLAMFHVKRLQCST